MNLEFFHGTSIGTGFAAGDRFDPSKSSYETCVWGTSSLDVARYWASSTDAMHDAGEVIYKVAISSRAKIKVITDAFSSVNVDEAIEEAIEEGFDAVVFNDGEDGASTIAILNKYTAVAETI